MLLLSLLKWTMQSTGLFSASNILSYGLSAIGLSWLPTNWLPTTNGERSNASFSFIEQSLFNILLKTGREWYNKKINKNSSDKEVSMTELYSLSTEQILVLVLLGCIAIILHITSTTELNAYFESLKIESQKETKVAARWSLFESIILNLYSYNKEKKKVEPFTTKTIFFRVLIGVFLGLSSMTVHVLSRGLSANKSSRKLKETKKDLPASFLIMDILMLTELLFHSLSLHKESPLYGNVVAALKLLFPRRTDKIYIANRKKH